ncbi:hypothetical protein BIV60_18965 [Bacillus sp. MUM 116]|uniref:hypothetical protein n=1 Tax=Bacillus sp. MUM 116 TaxID=1678002 RepID=UPI0008F5765E|nr:hypothetical protein [Bacillus sp. MUM 116]OIK11032.1 hypothetical protein BIV60_18965 [Bacillus sp. MUM 116]
MNLVTMEIVKELFSDSQNHKAVILKRGKIFEINFFKYFPECIDEEGDIWEEFWQEITQTTTITDT